MKHEKAIRCEGGGAKETQAKRIGVKQVGPRLLPGRENYPFRHSVGQRIITRRSQQPAKSHVTKSSG